MDEKISKFIKEVCIEISERYEIHFIEIGTDDNHVHFLIQSVPTIAVEKIVRIIKSIVARQVFQMFPQIKKELWGGSFWTSGYYGNTVGQYANAEIIKRYVENQGKKYNKLHSDQLKLW